MQTYIALLRGINVSGSKIIKMELLREIFESMQLKDVRTYIQSGNVVFKSAIKDEEKLSELVHKGLEKALGYKVEVVLRTPAELKRLINKHPYGKIAAEETRKLYVAFLPVAPATADLEKFIALQSEQEQFHFHERELYIAIDKAMLKPKFTNNILEKKLKIFATTRNWATVNKLLEMAAE
ncbi:DUF1697 domain-containing protein [Chitinophaga sp. Cy-1792]|uniref:DUF1697 domain-containing protein n=1 Tax=Chitinophaga sp. Cy-1792 TaxID=2608339 RepID=UPI0014200C9C|nr:DUF1697 domain-containing protein [Chitinophaga sp. Cy-1792]